ncbi:predicted protein [Uncinocarpus reesii 1704]|uniref:C2H2-type domain-containing protein n=1 Tax=Uncinocarpus reesii (strain UAMH 1704) TaxID=336963 RepID=C4JUN7_UNCRE|nr:uncharacterized protein UREG_04840 [Uncinocarpus reesii 1704]EEP79998.1 predicted protein [Uncinocarpus reesii 1704]
MADSASQLARRINCTFKGCMRAFPTEKELIKHKKYSPEHDYCVKCNEDFEDEESLLMHKIESSRHIVCPICVDEFKSEGGRDVHLRQIHSADQNLKCVGCQASFNRAHGLMTHIEEGKCYGFSGDEYRAQRAQKRATRVALNGNLGNKKAHSGAATSAASVDGGVEINIMDDSEFPALGKGKEKLLAASEPEGEENASVFDDGASELSGITRSIKHWPGTGHVGQSPSKHEDLMAFSELGLDDQDNNDSQDDEDENELDEWGELPPETEESERKMPQHFILWETSQFYNSVLGAYVCPCDRVFKTNAEISAHLRSGIHDGGVV